MNRIVIVAAALLAAALVCGCARHAQEKPYSVSEPPASIESAQSVPPSSAPASQPEPAMSKPQTPKTAALPELLVKTEVLQGDILVLRVTNAAEVPLTATTSLGFTPQFFPDGADQLALLPIRYTLSPGSYTLDVAGEGISFHTQVAVLEREFEVQHLEIDESIAEDTALSDTANSEWYANMEPLKLVSDPEIHWEGRFILPCEGELSTQFACIRYTNDDPNPTRHNGIDLETEMGTPAAAANNGRVLFAGFLQLTGNTVLIEHGCGLKSWYYHMSALHVQAGDLVEKGELIGEIGSTGYSNSPHMHFAISVNDVFVNPWQAVNSDL
ncbi:M23 family metallopeptidase [Anaerotruncus rubiinfantis]|uniref:M23 family metallopeptidase n=1 Tax=Anaerotruncus rubiinfantis TaxID=1720200 RepID=UPI0034A5B69C